MYSAHIEDTAAQRSAIRLQTKRQLAGSLKLPPPPLHRTVRRVTVIEEASAIPKPMEVAR